MPGGKCNIKIDSDLLKDQIAKKGLKVSDAGVLCGYSISGIQNAIDRHRITTSMAVLIDKVLGIPLETYEHKEYEKPVIQEICLKDADFDRIRGIIREELNSIKGGMNNGD